MGLGEFSFALFVCFCVGGLCSMLIDLKRFNCVADAEKGKKTKIRLEISISDRLAGGIKTEDVVGIFRDLGKGSDKKVVVTVCRLG